MCGQISLWSEIDRQTSLRSGICEQISIGFESEQFPFGYRKGGQI